MGVYKISYYLERDEEKNVFTLYRQEKASLGKVDFSEDMVQPLNANIADLNFQYRVKDEWLPEWKQSATLPEQVKIVLSLTDGTREISFSTTADIMAGKTDNEE